MAVTFCQAPFGSALFEKALALREAVFIGEQNVPLSLDRDGLDETAIHLVGVADGEVVAVTRILFKPEHAKIGRVAVAKSHRGTGLGAQVMRFALDVARQKGETRCYLESQADKIGFYERLGFVAFGEFYMEAGMPHRQMKTY